MLSRKKQLEQKQSEIDYEELNKYSVENMEKILKRMNQNLDRVTGANSSRQYIKEIGEKQEDYNKRNEIIQREIEKLKKNIEQMNDSLLNMVID